MPEHWISALHLKLTPGLGLRRCRLLLDAFGGCEQVLQAPDPVLRGVLGASLWTALRQPPPDLSDAQSRIRQWLATAPPGVCHTVLAWGDAAYPADMCELPDPPLLLFVVHAPDDPIVSWPPAVAMVGSRSATPQGLALTRQWAHQLADAGWCVVSGLARGIDAAAHIGAMQSERGGCLTMAAMATGPDRVYPVAHARLKSNIVAHGRCLTEQLPGDVARAMHFPLRNRLLVALSRAVLVVEADLDSGSLISAQCALDQGRDVMAVPGSILSPQSRGCHALIRQGATLVTRVDEVLDQLPRGQVTAAPQPIAPQLGLAGLAINSPVDDTPDPQARLIGAALSHDPLPIDLLQQRLGWPMAELRACLQALEWRGQLAHLPGDRVQWLGL